MEKNPNIVLLEILSNGTTHSRPSVIIRTQFKVYLFNCPEGNSRFLPSLRASPQTINDFFITRGSWDCFGGLFGVLLAKQISDHNTRLHGPPQLKDFLEYVRPFMDNADDLNKLQPSHVEGRSCLDEKYEDVALTVYYLPMSSDFSDIAYLVELKEPNNRIDIAKCKAKNVPNGPLIGELKAGRSIIVEGNVVLPEEVYAENLKDHCPNVLIVDCDGIEKLKFLEKNSHLEDYTNGQNQMGYIVHMTPESVANDEQYQKWMMSFGLNCLNLMVNGSGEVLPVTEGIYQQQRMLNEIFSDLFPPVFPHDFIGTVTQEVELPLTNLTEAKPLAKYLMRTTKAAKKNEAIGVSLEKSELAKRCEKDPSILEVINDFKKKVENLDTSEEEYPIVSFLGTGSAVPSKYRNVSGHLLQLNSKVSVLVDCGEGSYGQLKILHGPEKIEDTLIGLSAIFVTHAHLDHIGGIITIIDRRREAFESKGMDYKSLLLICNCNVKRMLDNYSDHFHNLNQYLTYIEIGFYVTDATDFSNYSNDDLITDVTKMLPEDVSEIWNLKAVTTFQVHHTRRANGFVFDTGCGKRIVFSGDTMPCELLIECGNNADLLIHEATFEDGYEEDAQLKKHSTTGQAIEVSKRMNAKHLILSHFSARYPRIPYISDLMINSGNVGVAFDNMVVAFNKHHLLPLLLPVYAQLFKKELEELRHKRELSEEEQ